MREPISLSDSTMDMVIAMSEGNPGGLSVLMDMLKSDDPAAPMMVLSLDDMNIRGTQIWLGYKDHCGSDMAVFLQAIKDRDPAMVATINEQSGIKEQAVTSGASFNHVAGQSREHRGMGR